MDNDRWQQIQKVFSAALEREGQERDAYLDQACGGDTRMREEVGLLLARDHAAEQNHFLSCTLPLLSPKGMAMPDGGDPLVGRRIGHYEIKRRIGSGGMGNVYLGVRADDFQQRVAIKLMRGGMDSDRIVRRFRNEMQFLAALGKHANIASIFDAGTTEDGRPYIVMEHIDGQRVDRYCDDHKLGIRARLELFCQACEAIQFAHQNAVLHRDLKPSNLLITNDGNPRLIDFGIAKLTTGELGFQQIDATQTMQRAMTPDYASPEQFRGEPVTTASDVYSLGVILYELLAGHRPYRTTGHTPAEIEQAVCDVEPVKPSTAVGRSGTVETNEGATVELTPKSISSARGLDPRRLQRAIRGDLDRIVMTALHKDVERRYATVDKLTADIQRYLDGRPVTARRDTVAYRFRKYASRNKALVASLAGFIGVLLVGIVVTTWLAVAARKAAKNERDQRLLAEQNELIAEQNEQTANRVVELFETMFAAADPSQTHDPDYTVRQLLDDFTDQLGDQLANEPLVEARLMHAMGNAYFGLGLYQEAADTLAKSVELRRETLGVDDPEMCEYLIQLGNAYREGYELGRAEAALSEALSACRRVLGADHEQTIRAMICLVGVYSRQHRFPDAERLLLAARRMARTPANRESVLRHTGYLYYRMGEFVLAEPYFEEALALTIEREGSDHPATQSARGNLANVLAILGRLDEAVPIFADVLASHRKTLGDSHIKTRVAIKHLADAHFDQGRRDLAEPFFREWYSLVKVQEKAFFGYIYDGILRYGICLTHAGQAGEAEPLIHDAYDFFFEHEGPYSENAVLARQEMQSLLKSTGREEDAAAWEPTLAATPRCLEPTDGAKVSSPTELVGSAFEHSAAAMRHRASRWQIRAAEESYAHAPTLDVQSRIHLTSFAVPEGLLRSNTTYHWRVAHVGSNRLTSEFSQEATIVTGDLGVEPFPVDLSDYFNRDVVANPGDRDEDFVDTAESQFLVDGFDGEDAENDQVQGLPLDRKIGPHLLGDYDDPNVVQLTNQDRKPLWIPISPGRYVALRLLMTGTGLDSSLPVTIKFADGTEDLRDVSCPDWFTERMQEKKGVQCTLARNGMDRMSYGKFDDANDAALFDALLPIQSDQEVVGLALNLADATYNNDDTRFNLLAVTAMAARDDASE